MRMIGSLSRLAVPVVLVAIGLAARHTAAEPVAGALVVLVTLVDVFFTVLYARMHSGWLSLALADVMLLLFRAVARLFRGRRATVLSLCGPAILVALVGWWALLLTMGAALIIHPALGHGVVATQGATPTDFATALYAAGSSISIVGASSLGPSSSGYRLLYLVNSLIGASVLSLTLTYLMQVYSALQRRNALARELDMLSAQTGDAAELLAGVGAERQFQSGYTHLATLASAMTSVKESHHLYPVLFYFRFPDPLYSVSRMCVVTLDLVTLIKSALVDDDAWLAESAAVTALAGASTLLVTSLERSFLPSHAARASGGDERSARRYRAAVARLRQADIATVDDATGVARYVELRACWDAHTGALASMLGYTLGEIDVAGTQPEQEPPRPPFRLRRHAFA